MVKLHKRPYWVWVVGAAVAWAIILPLAWWLDSRSVFHNVLLIFAGFAIGLTGASIARKVYK